MAFHHEIGPGDVHGIHYWRYATIADRDAHNPSEGPTDPITAEDVAQKRLCYVDSVQGYYHLTNWSPVSWVGVGSAVLNSHAAQHEAGGIDEVSVAGLSGVLADPQTPASHASEHEDGGADELSVAGLSGVLADPQTPEAHALDPGSGPHTGSLDEADVALDDATGHDHSGAGGKGTPVDYGDLDNVPSTFAPAAHAASHEDAGGDEINVGGLHGTLADPQPVEPHPLDPTAGDHTGTLAETNVLFSDTGHDHTGGTEGQNIPIAAISGLPSRLSRGEQPSYSDTVNKVIGPLATPPVAAEVALSIMGGSAQVYGAGYTARLVVGGTAPGWYVCIDPASSAPGGGAFSGGVNPTTGLALIGGDRVQLIYPTYPAP